MIKIRKEVFETNSSSVYSLNIRKNQIKKLTDEEIKKSLDVFKTKNNCLKINLSEYNWGWSALETPCEKLKYILSEGVYLSGSIEKYMFEKEFHQIEDYIIELGYKDIKLYNEKDCYIDHQSLYDTFKEDAVSIIQNNNLIIVIGNDNSSPPEYITNLVDYE